MDEASSLMDVLFLVYVASFGDDVCPSTASVLFCFYSCIQTEFLEKGGTIASEKGQWFLPLIRISIPLEPKVKCIPLPLKSVCPFLRLGNYFYCKVICLLKHKHMQLHISVNNISFFLMVVLLLFIQ